MEIRTTMAILILTDCVLLTYVNVKLMVAC